MRSIPSILVLLAFAAAAAGGQAVPQQSSVGVAAVPASALQAIVMEVKGKARWRPSQDADWREAKVNDILDPGTEVRTGLRSRVLLRVGRNASVLIDAGTSFEMPEVVAEGEVLRTTAAVRTGSVDFKVDKIDGFANDFKVVTPQTTLAVRGTGFRLASGPLQGFEVSGVRTNMINAIEINYAVQNITYFVSGEGRSTSTVEDPVQNAWVSTVGPPPIVGALVNNQQLQQQVAQGTAGNAPTNPQQQQQIAAAEANGEAGGVLVIAASDSAASDALRDLAIATTGRDDIIAPPTGGGAAGSGSSDGAGSGGTGSTDVADQLPPGVLRDALLFGRYKAADLAASSDFIADTAAETEVPAAALLARFSDSGIASQLISVTQGGFAAEALIRLASDQTQSTDDRGMPGELWGRVQAFETSSGRSLFTSQPFGGGSFSATANKLGLVTALENARDWADHDQAVSGTLLQSVESDVDQTRDGGDRRQAIGGTLRSMNILVRTWSPDAGPPGSSESATVLALDLNERLQSLWDDVVQEALTGVSTLQDVTDSYKNLTTAVHTLRSRLAAARLSDTQVKGANFARAYAEAADQAGTPAAAAASAEVASIVLSAQAAALVALQEAQQAYELASSGRTLGQRMFGLHAGNNLVRSAAQLAERGQLAAKAIYLSGTAIQENFNSAMQSASTVNGIPADLDTGLSSVGGNGTNTHGGGTSSDGPR